MNTKYSATIRSNAFIAVALISYHEALYNDLVGTNVIDLVMEDCMDPQTDLSIKKYSTLALVHFAFNGNNLNILLEKGVLQVFNTLSKVENLEIQTNVAWVFLALCNNGITGS